MNPDTLWGLKVTALLALVFGATLLAAEWMTGCTPAEEQVVLRDVDTALDESQKVCTDEELAAAIVPPGTSISAVVGDLSLACGVDLKYAPGLELKVSAKLAQLEEAGLSPDAGLVYKPGPRALAKLRARATVILDAAAQ